MPQRPERDQQRTPTMIDLPFVASRVFGTPLMMARGKLEVILGVLAPRLAGIPLEPINATGDAEAPTAIIDQGIAVVPVIGTLVSRSSYLDSASGLLAYADIGDAVASAMDDPSVQGVILDLDSPGGEVGGLFDLVETLRAVKAASNKPLWAIANECALSAAYAIASAADRLYVTRTGEVGSVGVVAVHVDESAADTKSGLAWTYVFAGETKIDGNSHQPLSERARATIQADVDQLYGQLCGLVASNRRLTSEAVRATDAAIYRGEAAIRAGLADRIGTLDQAIAEMAAAVAQPDPPARFITNLTSKRSTSMATNETEGDQHNANEQHSPGTPEPVAQPLNVEPAPSPSQLAAAIPAPASASAQADTLRAEYAEIAALAAQAARLGVTVDAADAMRKGISADALRRTVIEALAARSEALTVIAAAPSAPVAGDSPIVRRAKQRAAAART